MNKKIVSLYLLCLLCPLGAAAQAFSVGADIVSAYIWRGAYQGGGASIQPAMAFTLDGWTVSAWGNTNFAGGHKEVDLSVAYTVGKVSFSVTDYWWEGEEAFNYFDYPHAHRFEAGVAYVFPKAFPLRLAWNTFLMHPESGYPTYIEAAYPFEIKDIALEVSAGLTPWEGGLYADRPAVLDIGLKATKTIPMGHRFALPVFARLSLNPAQEDVFLVFGISIP
jgi:hypothetical protein